MTALADPTRQKIVEMLARGPLSSGDIASRFDATAPAISQHLRTLREAGLVRVEVDAQRRIYELNNEGLDEVADWLAHIRRFWALRLDVLESELSKPVRRSKRPKSKRRRDKR